MKIIAEKGIWLLLLAIYVCSCQKEEQPEKVKQLYIQLTMPESIHVDTKADDTGKSTETRWHRSEECLDSTV